ncbi:MAG: hypothetical protein QG635_767 [Bacteroidota bacterium]|nr:hypothetical protein [Bacteroidota bacterium]
MKNLLSISLFMLISIFSANAQLQSDTSDAVWSIVMPLAASQDVDMKQCLVGDVKDSLITDFVRNIGTYKFRVDSIYFQGSDAASFSLVSGFPKYIINPTLSNPAEFRFTPKRVGVHQAEIVIITQADTLIQNIRGEGIQPYIAVLEDIIDFGMVQINKSRDSLQAITIKNISSTSLSISNTKHGFPNAQDFSTLAGGGAFTLKAGDTCKMDLRFSPKAVGRTSGTLEFYYNGTGSPAIVQLYGEGININPPEILTVDSCYKVAGIIYNPNTTYPCLQSVTLQSDSVINTNVDIENFTPYVDTVEFSGRLIDIRRDGKFTITAQDSTGAVITKTIDIPGFTIAAPSCEYLDTLKIFHLEAEQNKELRFKIKIRNYGGFPQYIADARIKNSSLFSLNYNTPKTLQPGEEDEIELIFKTYTSGEFTDTLSIVGKCGIRQVIALNISTSDCDKSAFEYVDFSSEKGLNFSGTAGRVDKYIRLTKTEYTESGAMWQHNLIPVSEGFTSEFKFRISEGSNRFTNEDSDPGADGIAFVIQNYSSYINGIHGGGIGYHSLPNSLAVEFDTFSNDSTQFENYGDPNGNHIAVMSCGIKPNTSKHGGASTLGMNENPMKIKADGTIYYAKIDYKEVGKSMRIYLDTVKESKAPPILIVDDIELKTLLDLEQNVRAYVGFTAATGSAWENHDILSWYFCPRPAQYVSIDDEKPKPPLTQGLTCYPNPVNETAVIEFDVQEEGNVNLFIINPLGEKIKTILSGKQNLGSQSIKLNTKALSTGTYFIILQTSKETRTQQLEIVR